MPKHGFGVGHKIKVLTGMFKGGTGKVMAVSYGVPKCIGCRVTTTDKDGKKTTSSTLVWFDPDQNEIEKTKEK